MVGHYTNPLDLLDGGFAGASNLAFYTTNGTRDVENHDVPPDVEVEYELRLCARATIRNWNRLSSW